jgi:hypothetical protein
MGFLSIAQMKPDRVPRFLSAQYTKDQNITAPPRTSQDLQNIHRATAVARLLHGLLKSETHRLRVGTAGFLCSLGKLKLQKSSRLTTN